MTIRVLAAGDQFVLNRLLIDALRREVPAELEISELELPWPVVPFGRVGEVDEASDVEDELIEALRGVEVCVTQMAPLTRRVLEASPELKLFCVSRGGPVNANLEAATEAGVAVTFAPGRNAVATAEHTLAMLLAATRRIPPTARAGRCSTTTRCATRWSGPHRGPGGGPLRPRRTPGPPGGGPDPDRRRELTPPVLCGGSGFSAEREGGLALGRRGNVGGAA